MLTLKRFVAAYIDLQIVTVFLHALLLVVFGLEWYNDISIERLLLTIVVGDTMYILKDIFGVSIGKRIFGLRIINSKDCSPASWWKRIVRNIFMVCPPIDVITVLVRQDRRKFMDIWLGTSVVQKTGDGVLRLEEKE